MYGPFCAWPLSFSTVLFRLIHVVCQGFVPLCCQVVCQWAGFRSVTHSPGVGWHLGCFCEHSCTSPVWAHVISFGWIPRSGIIAGSCGRCLFSFLRVAKQLYKVVWPCNISRIWLPPSSLKVDIYVFIFSLIGFRLAGEGVLLAWSVWSLSLRWWNPFCSCSS